MKYILSISSCFNLEYTKALFFDSQERYFYLKIKRKNLTKLLTYFILRYLEAKINTDYWYVEKKSADDFSDWFYLLIDYNKNIS